MADAKPIVLVVDDDPDLRASVGRLLRSLDLDAQLFASIADFLKSDPPDGPSCLVLDVRLPGQSGLDFQRETLRSRKAGGINTYQPRPTIDNHARLHRRVHPRMSVTGT
jgi:FixJ family two-component response regulator